MDIASLLQWLQASSLAENIRQSLFLFPLLEAIHVIGLALVFGTIIVIDLRLLGIASMNRPFERVAADTLKWTWMAFVLTAVTGGLMFTTNATVYYANFYFRAKMVLLLFAAVNMSAFEATARRSVKEWDAAPNVPRAAKTVATLSLIIWIAVIFTGRLIGFSTTRASAPAVTGPEINFEDLLQGAPAEPPPTQGK